MLTIGIILIICGVILLIYQFITDIPEPLGGIIYMLSLLLHILGACFIAKGTPTKSDVFNGKAIYQETIHITGNDTIKTYKIVWKEK